MITRITVSVLVLCVLTLAQLPQPNHPEADLRLGGQSPGATGIASLDAANDLLITIPGDLDITVTSQSNPLAPVIFFASLVDPTVGATIALPWGDTFELGTPAFPGASGVAVVGDGLGLTVNPLTDVFYTMNDGDPANGVPPTFALTYNAGSNMDGFRLAMQFIVADATNGIFGLRATAAADANLVNGQVFSLNTGDDGGVQVTFNAGKSFPFHGGVYSDLWVNANGYVNFGGPTSLFGGGFNSDAQGWATSEPSIAAALEDWNPTGFSVDDGVLFEELGGTVRIAWGDASTTSMGGIPHFGDTDVNRFQITMELTTAAVNPFEGAFAIEIVALDPFATVYTDGLIGHTPGTIALSGTGNAQPLVPSTARDVDIQAPGVTLGPGEAHIEEHDGSGTSVAALGWDGSGAPRAYNNFLSFFGQRLDYTPLPHSITPGDAGYSVAVDHDPVDDIQNVDVENLSTAGGEMIIFDGKFRGFTATGDVVFDPNATAGLGPMSGTVLGVLNGASSPYTLQPGVGALPNDPATGAYRHADGLVVITPPSSFFAGYTGPLEVTVDFDTTNASSAAKLFTIDVVPPGIVQTPYMIADDGTATHALTVPVTLYGSTYNTVYVNSNGFVTFGAGSGDFTETLPEFFAGWGAAPNPGVAAAWTDLNRFGVTSGATYEVLEDSNNGVVECRFLNQVHWSSLESAGNFRVAFGANGANSVRLDHTWLGGFLPGTTATDDVILGVTDGDAGSGIDTDLSNGLGTGLAGAVGTYVSPAGAPDSIGELIPANTPSGLVAPVDFIDASGLGEWTIL